jgi:hypothetical protein
MVLPSLASLFMKASRSTMPLPVVILTWALPQALMKLGKTLWGKYSDTFGLYGGFLFSF